MKYEMIFGDEALFDGAPDGATHATKGGGFYAINDGAAEFASDGMFNGMKVSAIDGHLIAERRIIKEPKRWTWEDQRAGRLPEVGVKCRQGHKDEIVVAVTEKFVVTECQDMSVCTTRKDVFMRSYNPIETPAEKAQRLRDEWCSECTSKYYPRGHKGFPEMIYDALLSGELPMPKKGGE